MTLCDLMQWLGKIACKRNSISLCLKKKQHIFKFLSSPLLLFKSFPFSLFLLILFLFSFSVLFLKVSCSSYLPSFIIFLLFFSLLLPFLPGSFFFFHLFLNLLFSIPSICLHICLLILLYLSVPLRFVISLPLFFRVFTLSSLRFLGSSSSLFPSSFPPYFFSISLFLNSF